MKLLLVSPLTSAMSFAKVELKCLLYFNFCVSPNRKNFFTCFRVYYLVGYKNVNNCDAKKFTKFYYFSQT